MSVMACRAVAGLGALYCLALYGRYGFGVTCKPVQQALQQVLHAAAGPSTAMRRHDPVRDCFWPRNQAVMCCCSV
jgi:hypothetical protein